MQETPAKLDGAISSLECKDTSQGHLIQPTAQGRSIADYTTPAKCQSNLLLKLFKD